jgi:hypothetical protein
MKFVRLIPFLLLFSESCVEPYAIPISVYKESIVVDGMITNRPGPYFINLSFSSRTSDNLEKRVGVPGAIVTLYDNEGNSEQLSELFAGGGLYSTSKNGMQGVIGRSYHILIKFRGEQYLSTPSTINPPGTITDVYGKFEEDVINFSDKAAPQDAIRIYVNTTGNNPNNYFRWRWVGAYELLAYPQLRTKIIPPNLEVPDPVPCSGVVYSGGLQVLFPCQCCQCYKYDLGTSIQLSNNQYVATTAFNDMLVATIPYNDERMYFNYKVKVEQLSIDEDEYQFWNLVKKQQESRTDLFQPNTIRVQGNVSCVTDPKQRVLGRFTACGVVEKTYEIPRALRWNYILDHDTIKSDCRSAYQGSFTQKPLFW